MSPTEVECHRALDAAEKAGFVFLAEAIRDVLATIEIEKRKTFDRSIRMPEGRSMVEFMRR